MNKEQRKNLIKQYKDDKKNLFINSLPMSKDLFHELFDYLDERLSEEECKGNLEMTEEFLKQNNCSIEEVEEWLEKNGGGCDCEVLLNVEELFDEYNI